MTTLIGGAPMEKKSMNSPDEIREQAVGIDFTGLKDYAKEGGPQAQ
jgi:hypothetical protein